MFFFRVMLCITGLLLYLLIREFSDSPTGAPVNNSLQPLSPPPIAEAIPAFAPWEASAAVPLQPVLGKPADHQAQLVR
jgi:hypothetical protein